MTDLFEILVSIIIALCYAGVLTITIAVGLLIILRTTGLL